MNIVNCTPHAVTIQGNTIMPTDRPISRVETVRTRIADVITSQGCFPAYTVAAGNLTELPAAMDDTIFIVSAMVRTHPLCANRKRLGKPRAA